MAKKEKEVLLTSSERAKEFAEQFGMSDGMQIRFKMMLDEHAEHEKKRLKLLDPQEVKQLLKNWMEHIGTTNINSYNEMIDKFLNK